ncbi:Mannose or cellobiose epimerase, N-acyl-D-glucosamine 2-epimerase family [Cyclobacterium lianum]|uniref:Mannose or cellobiose epimerase, N-acyl-D-glucosamine 2-epimerase family n=2 Tax=Cyclobacterium lianum TaxID=388280 RepID=A0A1M7QQD3_9BACT|nr:Mannose or cellobiose epimerase, N-acyl-D-glucosamine 2-epimerase family [Cyclobacterium lianum]
MEEPIIKHYSKIIFIPLFIFINQSLQAQDIMRGNFWKKQVLSDVLEPWTEFAQDKEFGSFHAILDKDWKVGGKQEKYPGMIARHLFSYALGYHMTGDENYLGLAQETFEYLINKGWDHQYGGWFYKLDRSGNAVSKEKDMFMNAYAITGMAMYYIVTRNEEVRHYLDQSIDIMENHAWDHENGGGYFRRLHRDFRIQDSNKVFSPQLAPVSGYLLYLYAATREEKYLLKTEQLLEMTLTRMNDKESGWIMEGFDRNWNSLEQMNEMMNTGHNVEVAWMLMRLYAITGKGHYSEQALRLNEQLLKYAFDGKTGIWYHKLQIDNPEQHSEDSPWWVQAYGNMFQLYLYALSDEKEYCRNFTTGATFWNNNFIDRQNGGAYLSVDKDGNYINGSKAVVTKTSYHSVENGFLNMLYLDYWVNEQPATLYYHMNSADTDKLFPLLLEDFNYEIKRVRIDGRIWKKIDPDHGSIQLPERENYTLEVVLQKKQPR